MSVIAPFIYLLDISLNFNFLQIAINNASGAVWRCDAAAF
jgi:hypothetical protein